MKDRLEEFVRSHREEFDLNEPRPELWDKIEKSLKPKPRIRWSYYLSRAAVVIGIISASVLVQQIWFNKGQVIEKTAEVKIDIPELREVETFYTGMLNDKMEEIKPYLTDYPELQDELETDLYELDSIYISLKNDLKDDVANQEVLEAMIQNYRLRISILEDMLKYLQPEEINVNSNIEL
jgi:hypothetical protein